MLTAGDLIREARLRAGLTQRQLADRAGKAHSVVGRWERNEVRPPLETVAELVTAAGLVLAVTIEELDHDRGLIVETLALSPAERLNRVARLANLILSGRKQLRGQLPA